MQMLFIIPLLKTENPYYRNIFSDYSLLSAVISMV